MINYVLGYMFSNSCRSVCLIKKNRPVAMAGLWNGVGGKIEHNETSLDAMIREFNEETGVLYTKWRKYTVINGDDFSITIFYCHTDDIYRCSTITDEEVLIFPVYNLPKNLHKDIGSSTLQVDTMIINLSTMS